MNGYLRPAMSAVLVSITAMAGPASGHTYTHVKGALLAGSDLFPPANLTVATAEARCNAAAGCIGITFKSSAPQPAGIVQVYFKDGSTATSGDIAWQTYLKDYTPRTYMGLISATLGNHMVLQASTKLRPRQAVIWGFTKPGATVTTSMQSSKLAAGSGGSGGGGGAPAGSQTFKTTADSTGTWRQVLPATPPSTTPYTFAVASSNSTAERATLTDVLFGDVYLCGGQSNMEFGMPVGDDAMPAKSAVPAMHPMHLPLTLGAHVPPGYPLSPSLVLQAPTPLVSAVFQHPFRSRWRVQVQSINTSCASNPASTAHHQRVTTPHRNTIHASSLPHNAIYMTRHRPSTTRRSGGRKQTSTRNCGSSRSAGRNIQPPLATKNLLEVPSKGVATQSTSDLSMR